MRGIPYRTLGTFDRLQMVALTSPIDIVWPNLTMHILAQVASSRSASHPIVVYKHLLASYCARTNPRSRRNPFYLYMLYRPRLQSRGFNDYHTPRKIRTSYSDVAEQEPTKQNTARSNVALQTPSANTFPYRGIPREGEIPTRASKKNLLGHPLWVRWLSSSSDIQNADNVLRYLLVCGKHNLHIQDSTYPVFPSSERK